MLRTMLGKVPRLPSYPWEVSCDWLEVLFFIGTAVAWTWHHMILVLYESYINYHVSKWVISTQFFFPFFLFLSVLPHYLLTQVTNMFFLFGSFKICSPTSSPPFLLIAGPHCSWLTHSYRKIKTGSESEGKTPRFLPVWCKSGQVHTWV